MANTDFYRPDGPYSWIILVMVVLNSFSTFGFHAGTMGVLTDVIQDQFDEDLATTSIGPSLAIGMLLFVMPFVTFLMRFVGCRVIAAIGAVLSLIGVISTAFVTEFWQIVLSYSVVSSVGFSFSFVATIGVIPHYLQKRRAAAHAGIVLGAGVGFAAYPVIASSLITRLGFMYAILSLSTTLIFPIAAGFLFKPQLPKEQKIDSLRTLMTSYAGTFKHFVTPFVVLNLFLAMGSRTAIAVISFTYIAKLFESSVAVLALAILGLGFLVATLGFILYAHKFKANYLILHLTITLIIGVVVLAIPSIKHEVTVYIVFAVVGCLKGAVFGFIGNVIAHLFPTKDVAYMYGLTEASGGIGAFLIPFGAGYIESTYSYGTGFYFIGACAVMSSMVLCLAALIKPKLWVEYPKRCQNHEHSLSG